MKKRFLSLLCVLALCLGLLPVTALAAEPNTVYVGGVALAGSSDGIVYATTNGKGEVVTEGASADNYNIKWDGSTLTLHDATIQKELYASDLPLSNIAGAAIGVINQSGDAGLTVQLEGNNKIEGVSTGIHVRSSGGNATLNITGNGTLVVNSNYPTIQVISIGGNAALSIENAKVTATSSYSNVVTVESNSSENSTLTVNGGGLIATAQSNNVSGIRLRGTGETGGSSPTVTVSNNAIVRANGSAGGITSDSSTGVQYGTGSSTTGGIVFDGNTGTVYGNVTLNESLTINQGENLTIPEGSTLNTNGNLTNNGTIVDAGGTLTGEPGGIIVTAPTITTESLPDGTAGQTYSAKLEATGNNITWSVTEGTLPEGLTLNASTGEITGTPATEGQFPFTVTATNSVDSASKEYTLNIKPATVSVTGLKLDKDSLTLQENSSDTLTATVEPADATNKAVTWASSDTSIATVSKDGTVTAISAGNATITATAADGSGISASCELTVTHGNMIQTPKKDATCTVDGTEEYWTCEICGKHYKDESGTIPTTPEENKIPATNHSYGEPEWNWSENGKTCAVTFTCENDETHKETPEVKVTSAVKTPATCTATGVTTYTAAVEFNGQTYTDTKDVADIPATNHSYGEPEWNWSENGKTCAVTFTCENDETHKETPEVKVTSAVKTPATCTATGVTTYTATVEFNGQIYTDTKDVADIPATGHSYGKPEWSWSENGKTCTVTFTCKNDATHKETPEVTVTSAVKTPATCTETGVTTYTATVEFNGQTYTDTKDVTDIPATGHKLTKTEAKVPTVTAAGNTEYWHCEVCGKYFRDAGATEEIKLQDTVISMLPSITQGTGSSWQKGSSGGLTFTSNAAFAEFIKVQVDGKDLDAKYYEVKSGSTIVTLKPEYLETLAVGNHTLAILSKSGTAQTNFSLTAASAADQATATATPALTAAPTATPAPASTAAPKTTSPGTGDSSIIPWFILLAVGTLATGSLTFMKRRFD